MSFNHNTLANRVVLCSALPGMPQIVAGAWLNCEEQDVDNPTNPLNALYTGSRDQLRGPGRFARYSSAAAGLRDTAWVIEHLSYYVHVRAAIAAHASPLVIAHAIELSPFAGGHYGATASRLGCIARQIPAGHDPVQAARLRAAIASLEHQIPINVAHHRTAIVAAEQARLKSYRARLAALGG